MEKYDAIYGRKSVERIDSISIESQIEYCQYEVRGGKYKTFTDNGFSGKNVDRPQFQVMMEAIRRGEINRVIVYRLDRISRSILDFSTMMEEFQKYGVEFVSCTEKFDTSTPMGRAMLNICIVFAQLERETIQQRVTDAYMSRSIKGFYMGGRIPYGYKLEPYMLEGKKTAKYAIEPAEAEVVKLIYSMYMQPQVSLGDVLHYLNENGITNSRSPDGSWDRARIGEMIKNPIYVKADLDIYRFYRDQGSVLHNSPEDYIGTNGCYLFSDKSAGRKTIHLKGQHVVLAPHEGIVSSDVWLQARMKCIKSKFVGKPVKAKNSWLVGKMRCGKCNHAVVVRPSKAMNKRYLSCSHRMRTNSCDNIIGLDTDTLESLVFSEMVERLEQFETLATKVQHQEDPRILELNLKIQRNTEEIESLMEKVAKADDILMEYINKRVRELDSQITSMKSELGELSQLEHSKRCDVKQLRDCLRSWNDLSFDDKREVVNQILIAVSIANGECQFSWRI